MNCLQTLLLGKHDDIAKGKYFWRYDAALFTFVFDAIKFINYTYPALTFTYFILALTITVCTLQTKALRIRDAAVRRDVILSLVFAVTGGYLTETVVVLIQGLAISEWPYSQDHVVFLIASAIVFGIQALALTDSRFPVWYPYYGTWFIGATVETFLLVLQNIARPPHHALACIIIAVQAFRICTFIVLPTLYFGLRNDKKKYDNSDAERQSLLRKKLAASSSTERNTPNGNNNDDGNANSHGYGTTKPATDTSDSDSDSEEEASGDTWVRRERQAKKLMKKRLKQDGNWFTYAKGFAIFFPYVWPSRDKRLQFRAVLVGLCLLATNVLNVLVPNQMGVMIDSLTKYTKGDHNQHVWIPIAVYAALRFISGGGCIGWVQRWLWIPLEQYSHDALNTASHAHIMNLSSDFHDSKTSSDLIQAVQGGASVADLLDIICFQVLPMFIDLTVAFAYLWSLFGPYMGLMVAATATSYFYITTKLISIRAHKRRGFITVMRKEWIVAYGSIDGWTTASLFNNIPHEKARYSSAVKEHLKAKRVFEMSQQTINFAQALIMALGLLGALILGGYQVTHNEATVGKFTTLLVYWAQLAGPLTFFSNMFKNISHSLMDAERLLELFQTVPTITDSKGAKALVLNKGMVKFDRVSFAYDDRKPTLSDVSFVVPAGKTVALVGETGGGKSTILKLMGRFYDISSGSISIDEQDIRDVTISSLRQHVGIVPQDPTLFNDSVINNIRYSRLTASDEEVFNACRAAAIHDKITSFPDGYNSIVGFHGVKLSGGEKQRIAIARAILKNPELILLDEATSAVDTGTEQLIQQGLNTLCKDRTTLIVAHRLSTIMNADHIIVVMDGKIVEQGSHQHLLRTKGKYHDLWSKQVIAKSENERSRSRSPNTAESGIVKDLNRAHQKAEFINAMKNVEPSIEEPKSCDKDEINDELAARQSSRKTNDDTCRPRDSSSTQPIDTTNDDPRGLDNDKAADAGNGASNSQKHEASRLIPDAPKFVPLLSIPTVSTVQEASSSSIAAKAIAKQQEKADKEQRKTSGGKNSAKKTLRFQQPEGTIIENGPTTAGSVNVAINERSQGRRLRSKRARPPRRTAASSEPASRYQASHDGILDSGGDGQPLDSPTAMENRRVSAPSSYPKSRPHRARHWRLKNRAADKAELRSAYVASEEYQHPTKG